MHKGPTLTEGLGQAGSHPSHFRIAQKPESARLIVIFQRRYAQQMDLPVIRIHDLELKVLDRGNLAAFWQMSQLA